MSRQPADRIEPTPAAGPALTTTAGAATGASTGAVMGAVMGGLILLLWPLALLKILLGGGLAGTLGAGLFVLYLALAAVTTGWANRALAAAILAAALSVAALDDAWLGLWRALEDALIFAAFVPAAHMLRSAAERERRVLSFRERFLAAPPRMRPAWMLIGSNVLGSVLTIGAVAVLSPVFAQRPDAADPRESALAAVAGVALALTWSPFFVAMAVISDFLPAVPLWRAILLGMALSALGLALALAAMRTPAPLRTAARALRALSDFLPLVAIAGAALVTLRSLGGYSTLEAGCLALPPLCALLVAAGGGPARRRLSDLRSVAEATRGRLQGVGAEVAVVALAYVLGLMVRASPSISHAVDAAGLDALPGLAILFAIPFGMIAASMLSIHPIVSASLLLAVFAGRHEGVGDLALMGAALTGWASAAMVSYSGLLVMVTAGMGAVGRGQIILSRNLLLAPGFSACAALFLAAVDRAAG